MNLQTNFDSVVVILDGPPALPSFVDHSIIPSWLRGNGNPYQEPLMKNTNRNVVSTTSGTRGRDTGHTLSAKTT